MSFYFIKFINKYIRFHITIFNYTLLILTLGHLHDFLNFRSIFGLERSIKFVCFHSNFLVFFSFQISNIF